VFLGHFGVAFAGKRFARKPSLALLFAAAQLPDILWPFFLALGLERVAIAPGDTVVTPLRFESYPFSHSLVMMGVWAVALGVSYTLIRGDRRGGVVLGILVVSHWFLDALVHRPDMPLRPGSSPVLGLGLWRSYPATLLAEGLVFGSGLGLYLMATVARDRVGRFGLVGLVLLLLGFYAGAVFGPPPPGISPLVFASILGILILLSLAAWIGRHRDSIP
jgi:hypothetical protein